MIAVGLASPGDSRIWLPGAAPRRPGYGLVEFVTLSLLMLFWEVSLIRWISTEIRVFAYYKNLSLLAAYLGFGIGLLTCARQERWLWPASSGVAGLAVVTVLYPWTPFRIESAPAFFDEFTWSAPLEGAGVAFKFYGVILGVFLLNAAAFVPWGRRIGYYFERLRPIPAYSLNITANLLGIGLFSLLSLIEAPPPVWVAVGLAPLMLLNSAWRREPVVWAAALSALVVSGVQYVAERDTTFWSPYYKITVLPPEEGAGGAPFYQLHVNHDYHQRLLDLRPAAIAQAPRVLGYWATHYDLPYQIGRAGRVLVLGAGAGNDVAAALRHDAERVTAVEIDPTILRIGVELHPEHPYRSDRVERVVADARAFLANPPAGSRFDVIVFGLLDAHTQVSGMTSLRLDNFVYTRESLAQARRLLDPHHGLLALSFSAGWGGSDWTLRRLHVMLEDVFGTAPRTAYTGYDAGLTFLAGPAVEGHPFFRSEVSELLRRGTFDRLSEEALRSEIPATDDWPFLYLRRRALPAEYWVIVGLIVLVAGVWVTSAIGRGGLRGFSWHFFLLGAAFLLVEVKNLIALSLLFGSTWTVNNLAIAGILVAVLLANWVSSKLRIGPRLAYAALFAVLVLGLAVPVGDLMLFDRVPQRVLATLYLSLPIVGAGLVFIGSFARAVSPARALGANLLGGVCGGLLEYASLAIGFSALHWIVLGLYALSLVAMLAERGTASAELAPAVTTDVDSRAS